MSQFRFKPKDFYHTGLCEYECEKIAGYSNSILDKHLATCPVVTGDTNSDTGWAFFSPPNGSRGHTHRAVLFEIEELPKSECKEHVPTLKSKQPVGLPECKDRYGAALMLGCSIICINCGVGLTAKWEAEK